MLLAAFSTACQKQESNPEKELADKERKQFNAYVESLPALRPVDPKATHKLALLYLRDPELPEPANLPGLLKKTETLVKEYFQLKISLELLRTESVAAYFGRKSDALEHPVTSYPLRHWHINPGDPNIAEKIKPGIESILRNKPQETIEEYFGKAPATEKEYILRITDSFLKKNRAIYSEQTLKGRSFISVPEYTGQTSFAYWDSLLFQEKEADFILSNTLLAAPDRIMPLYVINRGGVTSGFVENSEHRPFQGAGILALYPFLSNGAFFSKERGALTEEETLECMAFLFLHELGHLLLHKQENYTLAGSVHRAPIDLDYKAWVQSIKARGPQEEDRNLPVLQRF